MNKICFAIVLCGTLCAPTAWADALPEPESTESSEDSGNGNNSEEKTGCSTAGSNLGLTLFPLVFFGWLALRRSREEQ